MFLSSKRVLSERTQRKNIWIHHVNAMLGGEGGCGESGYTHFTYINPMY